MPLNNIEKAITDYQKIYNIDSNYKNITQKLDNLYSQ